MQVTKCWLLNKENRLWIKIGVCCDKISYLIDYWCWFSLAKREFWSVSIIFLYEINFATCLFNGGIVSVLLLLLIWSFYSYFKSKIWIWLHCLLALLVWIRYSVKIVYISSIFFTTISILPSISINNFSRLSIY